MCGGAATRTDGLDRGYFVEPTVFTDCTDDMTIVREEIFGPVMCVLKFDDEDEVVAPRQRHRIRARRRRVHARPGARPSRRRRAGGGTCWINTYNLTPVEMPFGGVKQSGIGRENGLAALDHYTQLKTVYVETGGVDAPY